MLKKHKLPHSNNGIYDNKLSPKTKVKTRKNDVHRSTESSIVADDDGSTADWIPGIELKTN